MNIFLTLAFLFFMGSCLGWVTELLYRRFISKANPERKWINPGFCTGPYLPLYGSGLCILYLTAHVGELLHVEALWQKILVVLLMGICMTLIEYLSGLVGVKLMHVRLWDYSGEWCNIDGIICPKFSLIWTLCSAGYYFLIHGKVLDSILWLSENLAFSFFIGAFFGVFTIDICYNAHIVAEIKRYADEKQIVIRYENLKAQIKSNHERAKEKTHFLFPFKTEHSIAEHLKETQEEWEKRVKLLREAASKIKKAKK